MPDMLPPTVTDDLDPVVRTQSPQTVTARARVSPDSDEPERSGDEAAAAPPPSTRPWYSRRWAWFIAALVVIVAGTAGVLYWLHARQYESTDDAFIEARVIPISSKVAGHVAALLVDDNQHVDAGQVLLRIDPRDFQARLAQARAALAAARAKQQAAETNISVTNITTSADVRQATATLEAAKRRVATARAQVTEAEAAANRDLADARRYRQLYAERVASQQQLDRVVATARTSTARLEAARQGVAEAEAQLRAAQGRLAQAQAAPEQVAVSRSQAETAQAEIAQAQAAVQQAELELSYTTVTAPEAGRVTRRSVEEGAYVQPGQALMAIVPNEVWVIANFKETQLTDMRPGQPVDISVDAYPDRTLHGHVDSIQSGTGARFSLLPPENATGNYVKVVQRVPVKIVFDEQPDALPPLAPGLSVVPRVKVQ